MRQRNLFALLVSVGLLTLLLINVVVSRASLPHYASWTGIRPLEEKLETLEAFARRGPVDAVFIGSSISDFGVSASA